MTGTNWTNVTSFEGLLAEANTHAPFWLAILYMVWGVLTITFLPYGTTIAFLGGSFLTFLLGILLVYMGLIAWKWVLMQMGVVIFIIIYEAIFSKKES